MKTHLSNTGKKVIKTINYKKRKLKVSLNLNKRKIFKVFKNK